MESLFRIANPQRTLHDSTPDSTLLPTHRPIMFRILIDTTEFEWTHRLSVDQRAEAFAQIGYRPDSARPCVRPCRGVG